MSQLSFGAEEQAKQGENASNPLAVVNNTDARAKYIDLGDNAERYDYYFDGSYMATPQTETQDGLVKHNPPYVWLQKTAAKSLP
jgi:hypothetical protein